LIPTLAFTLVRYLVKFTAMQATATPRKPRRDSYRKVLDSRKRRVRGLWQRNGHFYANLTVADDLGRKTSRFVPLAGATLDDAKGDYARLLTERDDDRLRPLGLTPTLADYIGVYTQQLEVSGKRAATVEKEKAYLKRWSVKIGLIRLNKIRPHHLSRVLTELGSEDYAARSVNLYLISIRHVLKAALRDGHIKPPMPFEGLGWQRVDPKTRCLFMPAEVDKLCEAALAVSKNGRQFTDYLRFLQFSGARRNEALMVRWQDVDFDRGHVTIGARGDSKSRQARHVDFNARLEVHLKEMFGRRQPDSQWLFPSPQRGDNDVPARTYMESLRLTRQASGGTCQDCQRMAFGADAVKCSHCGSERLEKQARLLPPKLQKFGFHDLRHHFISYAVMSGLDFMTIARWVGHKDGGILIGKVYGHLADEHRKAQAARMNFGPAVVPLPSAAAALVAGKAG
jgi:integrase